MNILTIPLRNLRRKWLRTLLLLAVFSLGVASVVALHQVSKAVGHSLEKKLTAFGANILVFPKTESLTVSYGGLNLGDLLYDVQYLDERDTLQAIRSIELKDRLSAVAPKLVTMTRVNDLALAVVGVTWEQELNIKSHWAVDGSYPQEPDQVLLGGRVADRLGLAPGDGIDIQGRSFAVAGVLDETGGEDDNVILADLGALQALDGKPGQINFVEVAALCSGCPIDEITAQLEQALPGSDIRALRNVVEQRMLSVNFVQTLVMGLSLVILLTACCMVGLSMLSSVNERKKEIGILRSLGYARSRIFAVFSVEALLIGVLAGLVGYVGGFFASFGVLDALKVGTEDALGFSPFHLALTCAAIALVSTASSALPAWKASRVEPSDALVSL